MARLVEVDDLLTAEEHAAMNTTATLARAILIHEIQNFILAQAAARAFPNYYRPLGRTLKLFAEVKP